MPSGVYERTPETRARISAANRARWVDPEKRAATAAATAAGVRTPEAREKMSQAQKARFQREPQSAEMREKNRAGQARRWADEAARQKMSERMKDRWSDPEYRAKAVGAMLRVMSTPEMSEKLRGSHVGVPWEDLPAWMGPFLERAEMAAMLREQDGDLCQLCLDPIDFDLGHPDPGYVNIDHIRPRAAGGTDDPANLWLSHYRCNIRKGARHAGRPDGSTDRRRSIA